MVALQVRMVEWVLVVAELGRAVSERPERHWAAPRPASVPLELLAPLLQAVREPLRSGPRLVLQALPSALALRWVRA